MLTKARYLLLGTALLFVCLCHYTISFSNYPRVDASAISITYSQIDAS